MTVPGRDAPLTGKVSAVALLPTTGEDATTYSVTVRLRGGASVPTGAGASLSVEVDVAQDVVTVPASAVVDGAVEVLEGDTPVRTNVTVGAVSPTAVEVSGIEAGTTVVLADRDAELPSQQSSLPGFSGSGPMVMRGPNR